jgi:amino acid adenylation domain-containing protein
MRRLLHSGFLRSAEQMPERVALVAQGKPLTYGELSRCARTLAATLQLIDMGDRRLTGVFADRSVTAFAGILGSLMAGHGYIPLNPNFPVAKTRQMLERAGCRTLIVDSAAEQQLPELLDGLTGVTVIAPDRPDTALASAASWMPVEQSPDDLAYLLFTSGSTGAPKGVMVTHWNATHFVRSAVERYSITADDRLSQLFDTTFDLSVFDMFVAWQRGAMVCCPPRAALWNPAAFVREHRLTVWFSVPSTAMLMRRLGAVTPGAFPSLRWSLFCGEQLPVEVATSWAAAAPRSIVENLYGPTELTVACTAYRWDPTSSPAECEAGVVPIGYPLPGMYAVIVDDDLDEVGPGEVGELLVSGPQRTPGYWQDERASHKVFARVNGSAEPFYRTGDRVRRTPGGGPFRFVGRVDQQIKVHGYRVELGEVESRLLEIPGVQSAAAVPWPITVFGAQGIAAFVAGQGIEPTEIRRVLNARLQGYAVPQTIQVLPALPLNANGKIDRGALASLLDA